jgi:uncharacterized membrane protein
MTLLLFCFLLGGLNGLRSLTAPAAVCWAAQLGWLNFAGSRFAFLNNRAVLIVVTVLGILELVGDKLPKTPARTEPLGLIARAVFGALCGVALATSAGQNIFVPALLGLGGAITGTFAGYNARKALVQRAHLPDFAVALAEDFVAIAGSLLIVSHL